MKILLVSWSILPGAGGSSVIVENLARNFGRDELMVLGSTPPFRDNEMGRDQELPRFQYFTSELSLFGRGARYFHFIRKWRFPALVQYIKALITKEQIDYVIGVYPDAFYCHAACLAAKALGIPFSSYFHNTYVENVEITDPATHDIQREIFEYSRHIFVMSRGMQRFYEGKYALDKFTPLVHTFNQYPDPASLTGLPGSQREIYRLVAIGNFNESNMDATLRFIRAIQGNPKYSLSLYTHVPPWLLRKRGMDISQVQHKGFVTPDQVHDILQSYDLCLLTHGFTGGYGPIEYQTIFPTRTIPFLLSGKPIIAHSPPGSFLNDFIQENGCAELIDQQEESTILAALEQVCGSEERQAALVAAAQKTATQFYGPELAQRLKAILKEEIAVS